MGATSTGAQGGAIAGLPGGPATDHALRLLDEPPTHLADLAGNDGFWGANGAQAATVVSQGATGNPYIDGVLTGVAWAGRLTFSFPQTAGAYPADYGDEPNKQFAPVSLAQQNVARAAVTGTTVGGGDSYLTYNSVAAFTNLDISEARGPGKGLDGSGDIRLAQSSMPGTAYAYYPSDDATGHGGDVWFGTVYDYRNPVIGNYAYQTVLHELGHALGLKHSQEGGGPGNTAVPADRDDIEFSTMAYRSYIGGSIDGYTYGYDSAPQTYMMLDIQALQTMYGADYTAHAADTTYRWSPTTGEMSLRDGASGAFVAQGLPGENRVFLTTWDGGGNDTYDLSNYATSVAVDLRPGQWSTTSTGQLADLGNGHVAQGNVYNALLYHDDPASLIENAIGGTGADTIVGNAIGNVLTGGHGADVLTGAGGADTFQDTAAGLDGDTITDFSAADIISITDAVSAVYGLRYGGTSLSFKLAADASQTYTITLSGSSLAGTFEQRADPVHGGVDLFLSAGPLHPPIVGTSGRDTLTGTPGDDVIDGRSGADRMTGYGGDDTYVVDNAGDVVVEEPGGGTDTVRASVSTVLSANVENLILVDRSTIDGTGNALDNAITGTSGKNELDGGLGADTLTGGAGNDTYVVDDPGDVVVETADGGAKDLVRTTLSAYALGANVEGLTYTGSGAFAGTGNDLANTITGAAGNDRLDGGAGGDKLVGGRGDDTYVVDDGRDAVTEAANAGTDTVETSQARYTLGKNVENLTFTGPGTHQGTGNAGANVLTGGAGADTLDGRAGADVLVGGAGRDTFLFRSGEAKGDVVTDFTGAGAAAGDQLQFKGYGAGTLTHGSAPDLYVVTPDAKHGGAAAAETIKVLGVADLDLMQGGGHDDVLFV